MVEGDSLVERISMISQDLTPVLFLWLASVNRAGVMPIVFT